MMTPWYRRIFLTRLAAHRQAVREFITTRQGYRLATSTGGVLTGRGADIIAIDDPLKPEEALSKTQRQACNQWFVHTLYSRLNDKRTRSDSRLLAPPCGGSGGLGGGLCVPFPTRGDGQQESRLAPIGRHLLAFFGVVCFEPDASRARLRFKAAMRSMTGGLRPDRCPR